MLTIKADMLSQFKTIIKPDKYGNRSLEFLIWNLIFKCSFNLLKQESIYQLGKMITHLISFMDAGLIHRNWIIWILIELFHTVDLAKFYTMPNNTKWQLDAT